MSLYDEDEMEEVTNAVKAQTVALFDTVAELVPKIIPDVAKWIRQLYMELIEAGFTEDQAMKIVCNMKFQK